MSFGEGDLHDQIDKLKQQLEDLKGMLGELPDEGKCAMLLVMQVDGEYIWACEPYDFASYILVDKGADTYTGKMLNDPFDRADAADKLTMADKLRMMADELDVDGDALGVIDRLKDLNGELCAEVNAKDGRIRELEEERRMWLDGWAVNRLTELESLVRDMWESMGTVSETWAEDTYGERMDALGIEVDA